MGRYSCLHHALIVGRVENQFYGWKISTNSCIYVRKYVQQWERDRAEKLTKDDTCVRIIAYFERARVPNYESRRRLWKKKKLAARQKIRRKCWYFWAKADFWSSCIRDPQPLPLDQLLLSTQSWRTPWCWLEETDFRMLLRMAWTERCAANLLSWFISKVMVCYLKNSEWNFVKNLRNSLVRIRNWRRSRRNYKFSTPSPSKMLFSYRRS